MRPAALLLAAALTATARAQWTLQPAPTTADLRGIDNVGNGIAWASGTNGTILRTTDTGAHWRLCTIPPNAEHLDFRGIQAFDATTAIAMSSGPGDQSRLYKTTDACQTWTLLFTNPDKTGFFDALRAPFRSNRRHPSLMLLGDPVNGRFKLWNVYPNATNGKSIRPAARLQQAMKGEAIFAASNSSLFVIDTNLYFLFGTGGSGGSRIIRHEDEAGGFNDVSAGTAYIDQPIGNDTATSGVFSIAVSSVMGSTLHRWWRPYYRPNEQFLTQLAVAVGGDYAKPDDADSIAAYCTSIDNAWSGMIWHAATTQPHGYRSAVAYDPTTRTWITVGPNGTDISTDDGRNWRPLTPTKDEPADADKNWNALSLPYVVGPHGRIGILNPSALQPQP